MLAELKLAELNLAEANWSANSVFKVSGTTNPLTKNLASLISG